MTSALPREVLAREIEAFLDAHHVFALSTTGAQGVHAASLLYAREALTLVWTSDPGSRHSRELEATPDVAATVAPDYTDFRAIRGLQLAGRAARLTGAAADAARERMAARYAFLRELATGPDALRAAYAKAAFYRFSPARITLIDNTRGFGWKDTLEVSA